MSRFCLLLFLISGLISGSSAPAQSAPAQPAPAPAATVTLGHSLVPLNGPRKFHIDDNPQWARPNYDDGVAEVQDQHGRLFAFERIQELLSKPVSAAEIASAAQKFGQHDDISILSITRTAVLEEALA